MNTTTLKDALYNGAKDCTGTTTLWSHLSIAQAYARGIVVGIVSAFMADGMTFEEAIKQVASCLPEDYDPEIIPEHWR